MACSGGYKHFQVCWIKLFTGYFCQLSAFAFAWTCKLASYIFTKTFSCCNFPSHTLLSHAFTLPLFGFLAFFFVLCFLGRAHQGFGWVGEWANTGLVICLSCLVLFIFIIISIWVLKTFFFPVVTNLARRGTLVIVWFVSRHFTTQTSRRQTNTFSNWPRGFTI